MKLALELIAACVRGGEPSRQHEGRGMKRLIVLCGTVGEPLEPLHPASTRITA